MLETHLPFWTEMFIIPIIGVSVSSLIGFHFIRKLESNKVSHNPKKLTLVNFRIHHLLWQGYFMESNEIEGINSTLLSNCVYCVSLNKQISFLWILNSSLWIKNDWINREIACPWCFTRKFLFTAHIVGYLTLVSDLAPGTVQFLASPPVRSINSRCCEYDGLICFL